MVAAFWSAGRNNCKSVLSFSVSPQQRQHQQQMAMSSFVGGFRLVRKPKPTKQTVIERSFHSSWLAMMPEGPEVMTLVDQLKGGIGKRLVDIRFLSGRYLGKRPVGFSEFASTMTPIGNSTSSNNKNESIAADHQEKPTVTDTIDTILDWNCKGKFIYILMDDGAKHNQPTNSDNDSDNDNDSDSDSDSDRIDGENIESKNDFQRSIWITLGMTGRFVNEARHVEDPSYGRWVLELLDEGKINNQNDDDDNDNNDNIDAIHRIYYHDKRNFGTVKFCLSKQELDQKLNSLGPDVLALARQTSILLDAYSNNNQDDDPSITIDDELAARETEEKAVQEFLGLLHKQRNPKLNICKFLMDQKKIAGIGNYILSEALYRSNIDPFCGIDELDTKQRTKLFQQARAVCLESYRSQRESSNSIPASVERGYTPVGDLGAYSFELAVYGNQERCPKGNIVIRETNGPHGRTIWYTEEQLFVARNVREQRERDLQQQTQTPQNKNKKQEIANQPWTITRKDGVELHGNEDTQQQQNTNTNEMTSTKWNILDGLTDPGWKNALEPYTSSSPSFAKLQEFLQEEYSQYGTDQIYPPSHQIFAALNLCPLEKTKVVILGQDPYHGPNQSTGLAFSVSQQIAKIPPSLRNIFKELEEDYYGQQLQTNTNIPEIRHGDLEGWARQGVLMLNTVLTVRRGQANSHQKQGWEDFTDEIISILSSNSGIVFLLWGGPASKKAKSIVGDDSSKNNSHVVIQTSHPSPLGATKTASPFLTSRCFSRANAALVELGEEPIDWYDR